MILYKYIKADYIEHVLKDRTLKFSKPSQFNDPFEALPFVEGAFSKDLIKTLFLSLSIDDLYNNLIDSISDTKFKNTLEVLRGDLKQGKQNIEKWYNTLRGNIDGDLSQSLKESWSDNVGILSLSESSESLTMWAHYAGDHKGFVVGFKSDKFITNKSQILIPTGKVHYTCKRPQMNFFDLEETQKERKAKWIKNFYYTKSQDWSYENEWRQVNNLSKNDSKIGDNYLFNIKEDSIDCIIMGCKIIDTDKAKIESYAKELGVELYQMEINKSMYCLEKTKIDASL